MDQTIIKCGEVIQIKEVSNGHKIYVNNNYVATIKDIKQLKKYIETLKGAIELEQRKRENKN